MYEDGPKHSVTEHIIVHRSASFSQKNNHYNDIKHVVLKKHAPVIDSGLFSAC